MSEMTAEGPGASVSRANLAVGASLVAFAIWVVAGAVSEDLYALIPIPGVAGVVLGVSARREGSGARRALAAIAIGGLLSAAVLTFFVAVLAGWIEG